jgi:hypothetical protein
VLVSSGVVGGEVWAVSLFLFGGFSFWGFDVGFLFFRALLFHFVISSRIVGFRGRGRCGMWMSYVCAWRCESLFVC